MNETFWRNRARREAGRFNFAWWLQRFLPLFVASAIVSTVLVLALRAMHAAIDPALWLAGVLAAVSAVAAWVRGRSQYLTAAEALTRLDADLRLHTRLTSAAEGVGDWPAPRDEARFRLGWDWARLAWPPVAAAALWIAALAIPIPAAQATTTNSVTEPPAWTAVEEKLEEIKETKLLEEQAREEFAQSLESLRDQPKEDWYSHESLEAGDHLAEQLDTSLAALGKDLSAALDAMETARALSEQEFAALSPSLNEALRQSATALEKGQLNAELAKQLKALDASKLRQLSSAEYKALCERMGEGCKVCDRMGYKRGEKATRVSDTVVQIGQGGVSRGPGAAPLTMGDKPTDLGTKTTEGISNDDLSRATLGEVTSLGLSKPKSNTEAPATTAGGTITTGKGGETGLQQTATPEEQEALRKFFD
jgi:hypothetical protein